MYKICFLLTSAFMIAQPASAQADLDPLRRQAWMWREAVSHDLWVLDDSDSTSDCLLRFHDLSPTNWATQGLVGVGSLPFHRLGAMVGMKPVPAPPGTRSWHMLLTGLQYTFDAAPFPATRTGVMAWIKIDQVGSTYSVTTLNTASYGDVDFLNMEFDEEGTFAIDARGRRVIRTAWVPQAPSTALPAPSDWTTIASNSDVGGWLDVPTVCAVGSNPLDPNEGSSDAFVLARSERPTEYYLFTENGGSWTTSHQEILPNNTKGLIIRDALTVGGQDAVEVFAPTSFGSNVAITLEDDTNNPLLNSHTIATGSWQTLPALPALNARPGRIHDLKVDGQGGLQNWVVPCVRYGNTFNGKAGFQVTRGYVNPEAAPGESFRSGVHVSTTLPGTEQFTLVMLVGLRDAQGNDPLSSLGGTPILDFTNAAQVASTTLAAGVPLSRLGSSCGFKLDVPMGTAQQVVLFQYAFLFGDGAMALSDIFGGSVL